jgi:hypothetical protein
MQLSIEITAVTRRLRAVMGLLYLATTQGVFGSGNDDWAKV